MNVLKDESFAAFDFVILTITNLLSAVILYHSWVTLFLYQTNWICIGFHVPPSDLPPCSQLFRRQIYLCKRSQKCDWTKQWISSLIWWLHQSSLSKGPLNFKSYLLRASHDCSLSSQEYCSFIQSLGHSTSSWLFSSSLKGWSLFPKL